MNSIFFLIPLALIPGGIFAFLFILAVRDGQFDDLDDPPERVRSLLDTCERAVAPLREHAIT